MASPERGVVQKRQLRRQQVSIAPWYRYMLFKDDSYVVCGR